MKEHRAINFALTVFSASCLLLAAKLFLKLSASFFGTNFMVILVVSYAVNYPEESRRIFAASKVRVAGALKIFFVKLQAQVEAIVRSHTKQRIKLLVTRSRIELNRAREQALLLRRENFLLRTSNKRNELEIQQLRKELDGMQGLWMADGNAMPTLTKAEPSLWEKFKMQQHSFLSKKKVDYKGREVSQEI